MSIHDYVGRIGHEDWQWMAHTLGSYGRIFKPDLTIAPNGLPYLFRWHLTPYKTSPGIYMHLQVASDPVRPLHDHPWENVSHIRSGHYIEHIQSLPPYGETERLERAPGDVILRAATEAHYLELPPDVPYVLTIFTTGLYVRSWGFWEGTTWVDHHERIYEAEPGVSVQRNAT